MFVTKQAVVSGINSDEKYGEPHKHAPPHAFSSNEAAVVLVMMGAKAIERDAQARYV